MRELNFENLEVFSILKNNKKNIFNYQFVLSENLKNTKKKSKFKEQDEFLENTKNVFYVFSKTLLKIILKNRTMP